LWRFLIIDTDKGKNAMARQSPEEFIKSLQGSGILLVRNGTTFFIPLKTLSECILPEAFQKDAAKISQDYFEFEGGPRGQDPSTMFPPGQVAKKMDEVLSEFLIVYGISQAIWVDQAEVVGGKLVSKAGTSAQVLFRYRADKKRIVVDFSKGGRPSNR
jgi:hypothetical protein